MDAGNLLKGSFSAIRRKLARFGFYSPMSSGTVQHWTHPGMLAYLGLPPNWGSDIRNLNGACIAFDSECNRVRAVIEEWGRLALIRTASPHQAPIEQSPAAKLLSLCWHIVPALLGRSTEPDLVFTTTSIRTKRKAMANDTFQAVWAELRQLLAERLIGGARAMMPRDHPHTQISVSAPFSSVWGSLCFPR